MLQIMSCQRRSLIGYVDCIVRLQGLCSSSRPSITRAPTNNWLTVLHGCAPPHGHPPWPIFLACLPEALLAIAAASPPVLPPPPSTVHCRLLARDQRRPCRCTPRSVWRRRVTRGGRRSERQWDHLTTPVSTLHRDRPKTGSRQPPSYDLFDYFQSTRIRNY
jgi:hypothetical protein